MCKNEELPSRQIIELIDLTASPVALNLPYRINFSCTYDTYDFV